MFYRDILELSADPERLGLGYPGAWLNVGKQQIYLLELPDPDQVEGRSEHGGRDRHMAFDVSDINQLVESLEKNGIPYTWRRSGGDALFCRDSDGNGLEFIEN